MEQAHLKMLPTDGKTKVQILIVRSERTSRLDGELGYSKSPSRVRRESSTHRGLHFYPRRETYQDFSEIVAAPSHVTVAGLI